VYGPGKKSVRRCREFDGAVGLLAGCWIYEDCYVYASCQSKLMLCQIVHPSEELQNGLLRLVLLVHRCIVLRPLETAADQITGLAMFECMTRDEQCAA